METKDHHPHLTKRPSAMGRRDQLIRIALAAHQPQILEPVTPADSEDGLEEQLAAVTAKSEKIQRIDGAQEAVLSAIGFMSGAERKKAREQEERNIFSVSAVCGFINYHLPLPLACQRYQAMTFRHVDQSYLSLFKRSWRKAGWSLMCVGMPSLLVYQLGYAFSMHYLQPRIVHRFRKSYPPAAERTLSAFFTRLGVSLSVNLVSWFVLYPFWRHATLQSLLWIPYWEFFPPREAFYPRHNWNTFAVSYLYNFGIWLLQINIHKAFKTLVYPSIEAPVEDHEGTYPSSLTAAISDTIPMVLGFPIEIMLLRGLARDFGPSGLVLNSLEFANIGLLVKAIAAEWAVEWAWLEAQYWVNELSYWYKGYHD